MLCKAAYDMYCLSGGKCYVLFQDEMYCLSRVNAMYCSQMKCILYLEVNAMYLLFPDEMYCLSGSEFYVCTEPR